jgi:hypothetical protein
MKTKRKTKPRGVIQPRAFPAAVRARLAPVWVTVDEKKAVEAAAKREGLSISEFIRRAIEEKAERGDQ